MGPKGPMTYAFTHRGNFSFFSFFFSFFFFFSFISFLSLFSFSPFPPFPPFSLFFSFFSLFSLFFFSSFPLVWSGLVCVIGSTLFNSLEQSKLSMVLLVVVVVHLSLSPPV